MSRDRAKMRIDDDGIVVQVAVATQTIYHDTEYPSHITLPVIPR